VLARSGKSVFYLSLEDFPSTEAYLPTNHKNAMSDVFYYSKEHNRNFIPKLMEKAEKAEGGYLNYLSPSFSVADIEKIAAGNWEFVLNELKSNSSFDYVVADFSSRYDDKTLLQLSFCDHLILLTSTDYPDTVKFDAFLKTLELTDSDLLKRPSVRILNQYSPGIKYDVPRGGYGIPYINGLTDKSQLPYEVGIDSLMGKILMNLVISFSAGENR
jgi:cellulose biosynthesis protein BcsQ